MYKLNTNNSPLKQEEGTYRFALNTITHPEHISSTANEPGNELCLELDDNLVGPAVILDKDRQLMFLADNSVWIINTSTCTKTKHCQLPCFNWDTLDAEAYPITATYRVVRGCEEIVYLFNGIQSDKFINLTRPEKQKTDGEFDCSKFELNPEIIHSTISRTILNSGGNIEYGTYNFAIEFLNQNEDSLFVTPIDINYTPILDSNNIGALNLNTNLPDIGGKPKSSQSVKLNVTNIPEDAILARIIVFRHITGDGFTPEAHVVGSLVPINGTSFEYVYRGFNPDNGDYLTDKNEYLVPKGIYASSLNGLQVGKKLIRYNLKETIRDYSDYQMSASTIHAKYIVSDVDKTNKNIHLLNETFIGGEIILPCINYVHRDGTISNSYPLIGRTKNGNDSVLVDDIINNNQQIENWKLNDTSIKDDTAITGYSSSGEFGYYESTQTYTDPPNYCGESYWGVDIDGNPLINQNVRLFVVPDRSVEAHEDGNNIRPIGILFDKTTIEYPNTDVVGHYFSVAIVNQSNIESKGFGINQFKAYDSDNPATIELSGWYNFSPFDELHSHGIYTYVSPEGTVENVFPDGEYVTAEGHWNWHHGFYDVNTPYSEYNGIFEDDLPYSDLRLYIHQTNAITFVPDSDEHRKIDKSVFVDSQSIIENVHNNSLSNMFHHVEFKDNFNTEGRIKYLAFKNNINPIPNIWSIHTRRITEYNSLTSFAGGYFISPLQVDNVPNIDAVSSGILFWQNTKITGYGELVKDFFIESKVNSYLRFSGTDTCNKTLQQYDNVKSTFLYKMIEPYKDEYKLRDSICSFFSGYNTDYSYIQSLNKYKAISLTFDFCSTCTGLYPNRLIFSPSSFSEDLSDSFRINLANDNVDIPADTGPITAVDYKDNKLVIRTERSCYFLQPNAQELETSESNVYIGTGDFLSIPPQELNVSQTEYGGQVHKLDSINCEKALIWGNRNRGDIYHIGGKFMELSRDMANWFNQNLSGEGSMRFAYDVTYDRLIITKVGKWTLSYCFIVNGWKSWHSYIPDWYAYDASTFYSVYDNKLWKHNASTFHKFYDLDFPHIIELTINEKGATFLPQSIQWYSNTYDTTAGYNKDEPTVTYDGLLAYNETQSTGNQTLVLDDIESIYFDTTKTHVKLTDRNYKASPLNDLATSNEIWSTDISSIKQGNNQGYMDLIPVVDFDKNQVEMADFRGKWLNVRLSFNDTTKQIILEMADSLKLNSLR